MNTITELLTDLACALDDMSSLTHTMDLGVDRDDLIAMLNMAREAQQGICSLVFAPSVDLAAAFQQSLDDETAADIDQLLGSVVARADHPTSITLDEM